MSCSTRPRFWTGRRGLIGAERLERLELLELLERLERLDRVKWAEMLNR